jgi:hypothetical protein
MKKLAIVVVVLFLAGTAFADDNFLISVGANAIRPSDGTYRSIYGGQIFYPEVQASYRIFSHFYATAGYGAFSKSGRTPELNLEAQSSQSFLSFGLSGIFRVSSAFCVEAQAAGVRMGYKEEALDIRVTGSAPGFKVEGGVLWMKEAGEIFLGLKGGFVTGTIKDRDVRLGGAKVCLVFGIRLFGRS